MTAELAYAEESQESRELEYSDTDTYRVTSEEELKAEQQEQQVEALLAEPGSSSWLKKFLWFFFSLIILIGVLGSVFWVKRMELAKDDEWRPIIDEVCKYFSCGIPERRALDQLFLQEREVTPDGDGIKVTLLLVNRAKFKQAYPRVQMSFSDLDGNLIATHLILPAEYLRADLIGTLMPVNVPVYIEFHVDVDPQEAFGFEFKFL